MHYVYIASMVTANLTTKCLEYRRQHNIRSEVALKVYNDDMSIPGLVVYANMAKFAKPPLFRSKRFDKVGIDMDAALVPRVQIKVESYKCVEYVLYRE